MPLGVTPLTLRGTHELSIGMNFAKPLDLAIQREQIVTH